MVACHTKDKLRTGARKEREGEERAGCVVCIQWTLIEKYCNFYLPYTRKYSLKLLENVPLLTLKLKTRTMT